MLCAKTLVLLILCGAAVADAETYKWIDDRGVVSFTDNPSLIPHKYRTKALNLLNMKSTSSARKREEKILQDELMAPQSDSGQQDSSTTEILRITDGHHLSGTQTDPAPPSMKQPVSAPLGDQPKPTPLGMKQPIPAQPGVQPSQTPAGMKQPIPAPLGDQPKATSLGMEQPVSAK